MAELIHEKIWSERFQLARLSERDLTKAGLLALIVGLIFAVFHFVGNTSNLQIYGRSVFSYTAGRWGDMGGDFSHGWLIPLVSLFLAWSKRRALIAAPKNINRMGLAIIIAALMFHWLGAKAEQARMSIFAFITLTWAIPLYLCGWKTAKQLIFPCSFLLFAIPMNFLETITFPLRISATVISTSMLNGIGLAVHRVGTAIYSTSGTFQPLDVADPCSGLRSLLALTALTAVYAYMTQPTFIKKWILFLCSIPLAIAGNVGRITTIALVASAFGEKAATGLYHDYSGYIVFAVSITLMIVIGGLMNVHYADMYQRLKQPA